MSSFAIIGSGGLGGFYGGCLARHGHEVHFHVRDDLEQIRKQGWIVESKWGDFVLPQVNVYNDTSQMPQVDFVIVAIKSTSNEALVKLLPPILGSHTVALVLQNGLFVEEDTAQIIGPERTIGGCCFLCSNKKGPGHIQHLDYGRIEMAAYRGRNEKGTPVSSDVVETLAALFQAANVPASIAPNLSTARWRKLMWNIPFNGLSVALNASTSDIMQNEFSRQLALDLMLEVETSASAIGLDLGADHVQRMMEHTEHMVPYDSSMRLDYLAGRPMEIQYIFQNPILAAVEAGYSPLKTTMLFQQLSFLNRKHCFK